MPEVKCTVENCEYWSQPNVCTADRILITAGPAFGKDKHGANAEQLPGTPVAIAEETYCWTMTPRAEAFGAVPSEAEVAGAPTD